MQLHTAGNKATGFFIAYFLTNSISVTWALARNTDLQDLPQIHSVKLSGEGGLAIKSSDPPPLLPPQVVLTCANVQMPRA